MTKNGEKEEVEQRQRPAGVSMFTRFKQDKFPKEFLTPGITFPEALNKGVLRDERQRNAVVLLFQQMDEFKMTEEKQGVINWLTGSTAINGRARTEALEAHDEIFFPEATSNHKLSKDERQTARDMYLARARRKEEVEGNVETP